MGNLQLMAIELFWEYKFVPLGTGLKDAMRRRAPAEPGLVEAELVPPAGAYGSETNRRRRRGA